MAKEKAKKDIKNKKHFWKDFKAELKKVIWPTPKQLFKNTLAVIFIVIITAGIVFVLDVAFDALNNKGINRLKSAITSSASNSNTEEELAEGEETTEVESEDLTTEETNNVESEPEA